MKSTLTIVLFIAMALLCSCQKKTPDQNASLESQTEEPTDMATGRVAIPDSVRRNLGITFAKVTSRPVAVTLRYPGRFELLPEARRDFHAPTAGRVRLAIRELEEVKPGQILFRLEAPRLRDLARLLSEVEATALEARAQVNGLPAFREAHRSHETALQEAIRLWEARVKELEQLALAGGGRANELAEARASLMAARVDLAETQEKDAELGSREGELTARVAGAEARSVLLRREIADLARGFEAGNSELNPAGNYPTEVVVRAESTGRVVMLKPADGGWLEEGALVLQLVDPDRVRFRASAPQGDFARLTGISAVRLAPPNPVTEEGEVLASVLQFAPEASHESRSMELLATPTSRAPWARPGMVGFLEASRAGAAEVQAVPKRSVLRDGTKMILFRRDHRDPNWAVRMEADLGVDDGRFIEVKSGLTEGDEVVVEGAYQLLLATSSTLQAGGHFHADGTFHAEGAEKGKD